MKHEESHTHDCGQLEDENLNLSEAVSLVKAIADLMAMPDIDGALVGGASLKAESFAPMVRYRRS